jgi:hypothetical protein
MHKNTLLQWRLQCTACISLWLQAGLSTALLRTIPALLQEPISARYCVRRSARRNVLPAPRQVQQEVGAGAWGSAS